MLLLDVYLQTIQSLEESDTKAYMEDFIRANTEQNIKPISALKTAKGGKKQVEQNKKKKLSRN